MNLEISEYVLTSWHSHFFRFPTSSVLSPPTGRFIKSEPEWKTCVCATAAVRIQPLFCNYSTLERCQQKRQGSFLVVIQSMGHVEFKKTKKNKSKDKTGQHVGGFNSDLLCFASVIVLWKHTHMHDEHFFLDSNFQPWQAPKWTSIRINEILQHYGPVKWFLFFLSFLISSKIQILTVQTHKQCCTL